MGGAKTEKSDSDPELNLSKVNVGTHAMHSTEEGCIIMTQKPTYFQPRPFVFCLAMT